jgi:REP element-mobilizing transposase RayT
MPDHVHFIIEISDAATVGAAYHAARQQGHAAYPQNGATRPQNHLREKSKMAIPKIIQQFKTATMKLAKHMDGMNNARRLYDVMGGLNDIWLYESRDGLHDMQPLRWQRGYYDHIIRNEEEYGNICRYMETNPQNWRRDEHLGDFAHENENLDL